MNHEYKIIRPRLHPDFELPTRNELLKLQPGKLVKLMFQVGSEDVERMWVLLSDTTTGDSWKGRIDNDAIQTDTAKVLPAGEEVVIHPLDVISIY